MPQKVSHSSSAAAEAFGVAAGGGASLGLGALINVLVNVLANGLATDLGTGLLPPLSWRGAAGLGRLTVAGEWLRGGAVATPSCSLKTDTALTKSIA